MTLDLMKIGDKKKIIHIDNDLSIKKRLLEIGLSNGIEIECILINPFKNLSAYRVKDTTIAIRKSDGKKIEVDDIVKTFKEKKSCDIYE